MRLVLIFLIVYVALFFIGFFGYKIIGSTWTNSFLDATFLISGGNPVHVPEKTTPKIFLGFFIVISHIAFIILFALIVAYLVDTERIGTFSVKHTSDDELYRTMRELNQQLKEMREGRL